MKQEVIQKAPEQAKKSTVNLTGIPTQMKLDFERRSGLSFDDVRVHYNSDKPAKIGALAYTQGTQVHVGPGQERHLRHELVHVAQQKYGMVRPTATIGGLPVNLDPRLEHHADTLAMSGTQASHGDFVVQMVLPKMLSQLGCDCGFSALARAIWKLQHNDEDITNDDGKVLNDRSALENQLASYAVEKNLSTLGEAFNPDALVQTCNALYGRSIQAKVQVFKDYTSFLEILISSSKDSVILFPYFPDDNFFPVPAGEEENAHWGVLDPQDLKLTKDTQGTSQRRLTIPLYEGNCFGTYTTQEIQTREKLEALEKNPAIDETKRKPITTALEQIKNSSAPRDVSLKNLYQSNQSLATQFDWSKFIADNGLLDLIFHYQQFRREAEQDTARLKKAFNEVVKSRIEKGGRGEGMVENVSLQGQLIVLTRTNEEKDQTGGT